MTSAASLARRPGRSAPPRARDVARRPWPSWRCRVKLVEERGGLCVGVGGTHEDAVDRCRPCVDVDAHGGESGQQAHRVLGAHERADMRPIGDGHRLVVTGDGCVEQCLQDPLLRREQPVHRRLRNLGVAADRVDGRGAVAPLEKQGAAASSTARRAKRVLACGVRGLSSVITVERYYLRRLAAARSTLSATASRISSLNASSSNSSPSVMSIARRVPASRLALNRRLGSARTRHS